jgi:thiamine biosynthesis protein ThiS
MITVNKQEHEWSKGMTIQQLLEEKKYTFPRIVVKVNGKVVRKPEYRAYRLNDGDVVDAIHMVSGG